MSVPALRAVLPEPNLARFALEEHPRLRGDCVRKKALALPGVMTLLRLSSEQPAVDRRTCAPQPSGTDPPRARPEPVGFSQFHAGFLVLRSVSTSVPHVLERGVPHRQSTPWSTWKASCEREARSCRKPSTCGAPTCARADQPRETEECRAGRQDARCRPQALQLPRDDAPKHDNRPSATYGAGPTPLTHSGLPKGAKTRSSRDAEAVHPPAFERGGCTASNLVRRPAL